MEQKKIIVERGIFIALGLSLFFAIQKIFNFVGFLLYVGGTPSGTYPFYETLSILVSKIYFLPKYLLFPLYYLFDLFRFSLSGLFPTSSFFNMVLGMLIIPITLETVYFLILGYLIAKIVIRFKFQSF